MDEYIWDPRDREPGEVPETLTQQYLRVDVEDDPWKGPGFEEWSLASKPSGSVRMTKTGGFGYWETVYQPDTSGDKLREPSSKVPKNMQPLVINWTGAGKMKIKALKRYAIQYQGHIELVPVRSVRQARGFLRGIETSVPRERDRD